MAGPFKVKAVGPAEKTVGYYNHARRQGGDIFLIDPTMPEPADPKRRRLDGRTDVPLAFSEKWMEKVPTGTPLTHAQEARPDYAPKPMSEGLPSGEAVKQPPQAPGTATEETPL
jgi:hypothetical protein